MNDELRVFIADDEPLARSRLRDLLSDVAAEAPTRVVGEAANGVEALERLPASDATVLFLDIQMPGMGGLEVARHLALLPAAPAIVFVTAHDEHAVEAFELNALDYLMKPVRAQRLAAALKKAAAARPPERERLAQAAGEVARENLAVAERNRIVLVPVRDIVYLKAEQKYVTVRTKEREHLVEESLVSLEKEFAASFVRVHRNCLVARGAIRGFEKLPATDGEDAHWQVLLHGIPEKLPVSRRQWAAVRDLVTEHP